MLPEEAMRAMEIKGLTADSRQVAPGFLFAALPGSQHDGRDFIDQAVERGAVAVLAPANTALKTYARPVALIGDANPRRRLALMAARFHGRQPATIAAVTGTNGKTSVAEFTRQIWQYAGQEAASLGTLGLIPDVVPGPGSLTTPDPIALHRCLAALAGSGTEHLAIEASSHGLAQYRLDGLAIEAAAFTNLSRDHLDYHGSMAAYLEAKARLFADLLPADGTAVLNADAPEFEQLRQQVASRGQKLLTYGTDGRDLQLIQRQPRAAGQDLTIAIMGRRHAVSLPLAGAFQAMNALAALGLAIATGTDAETAVAALATLQGVRGRLERVVETPAGGSVYVDYAHTPDALETVLTALRPHTRGRLSVVFGCGGDRDRGKRPLMGEIAARLADDVIVTDDNPRGEDPAAIRREILAAAPEALEIGDRGKAIARAMAALGPGDILVVAGKGHEVGQTIGGKVLPFDDREVARAVFSKPAGGAR